MSTFFQHFRSFGAKPQGRGFTLIELLAVVSIMLILTSVLLLRQQQFDSSTILRSLSYGVALSIRQAQTYGTSVREFGGTFDAEAYGVHFCRGCSNYYILFADRNDDGLRAQDGSEDVDTVRIGQRFTISKICGRLASCGAERCSSDASVPIDWLNVYFRRPSPDARFRSSISSDVYSTVYVQLMSPGGSARSITVYPTGQIAVGTLDS